MITKLKLSHYKLKKIKDIICIIDTGSLDVSFIPIKLSRFMKSITSPTEILETQIIVESLFNLILFLCQITFYFSFLVSLFVLMILIKRNFKVFDKFDFAFFTMSVIQSTFIKGKNKNFFEEVINSIYVALKFNFSKISLFFFLFGSWSFVCKVSQGNKSSIC
jgi:hypothetical protein